MIFCFDVASRNLQPFIWCKNDVQYSCIHLTNEWTNKETFFPHSATNLIPITNIHCINTWTKLNSNVEFDWLRETLLNIIHKIKTTESKSSINITESKRKLHLSRGNVLDSLYSVSRENKPLSKSRYHMCLDVCVFCVFCFQF